MMILSTKFRGTKYRNAVSLLMLWCSGVAVAQDAGSVLFAKGSVTAQRQAAIALNEIALQKGDAILVSDTIATGDASRAQLLMSDGAKIAIRPNSQIRIDDYQYATATSTVVEQSDDKSVLSLVKGGFRTITGAIGDGDRSNYEVRTAVGVLGIRGTSFAVLLCGGDCDTAPNVAAGDPVEDGLYIAVTEGSIFFRAPGGEITVNKGEFAFIPMSAPVPRKIDSPPALLIDDSSFSANADGSTLESGFDTNLGTRRRPQFDSADADDSGKSGSDAGSKNETPRQPVFGIDADGTPVDITPGQTPRPVNGRLISYSTGPLGASGDSFSGTQFNEVDSVQLDQANNVTGFLGPYPERGLDEPVAWDIGSATNVDTGFDSVTVLRWGRWSGGVAEGTLLSDGSVVSIELGNQSLHWISGPDQAPPVMPITGNATYSLVGATAPTDNQGNAGVLGSATFDADFTNLRVDSTLVIDIGGVAWSAAGTGNIGAAVGLPAHLFLGNYANVVIGGVAGGSGNFSGFFSAPGDTSDPGFPGGVGLTYSLRDGQGTTSVSGAAAFGSP